MAKNTNHRVERDLSNPSLTHLLRPALYPITSPLKTTWSPQHVLALDDRRVYRPDRSNRPPPANRNAATRIRANPTSRNLTGVQFAIGKEISLCQRRKQRREVFHALRLAGRKGTGKGKPRRTNFWSEVKC